MKRSLALLALLLTMLPVWSETTYSTLSAKAARFFALGEWASASAMYTLMLDQRTDDASVFGHAIVAAGMNDDTKRQIDLINQALNVHQPIDSVLLATQRASLSAEQTSLYERFLFSIKEHEPWLNRVADSYLLNYYLFRDNGPGIVAMSETMLAGLPDNERFLYTLAHGKLLCGDITSAIDTYKHIVELNPEAYDALLYLGNYYAGQPGKETEALSYLSRAQQIRHTPHVESLISKLQ